MSVPAECNYSSQELQSLSRSRQQNCIQTHGLQASGQDLRRTAILGLYGWLLLALSRCEALEPF